MKTNTQLQIPAGYMPGMFRGEGGEKMVTHLYHGNFNNPGLPMCRNGWHYGSSYSIFRNNISPKGVCKTCLKRAQAGMQGVALA